MEFVKSGSDYDQAVVVFPPEESQTRKMFLVMMRRELDTVLTTASSDDSTSSATRRVAWSDRGWRRREDFHRELEKAISDSKSTVTGIVIARSQTLQEAENIVSRLAVSAAQVKTRVLRMSEIVMYSSAEAPPSRVPPQSSNDEMVEEKDDVMSASICPPTDVRHNIVLYAPDRYLPEDYEWDTTESGEFIDQWYDREIERTLCRVMRGQTATGDREELDDDMDVEDDLPGSFSWSDRGWIDRELFVKHTKASLKKAGKCSLLRRATFRDAMDIFSALEEAGFEASLFVTPALEAEKGEEDRPVIMCPDDHPTIAVDNGYHGTCSVCFGESRPNDLMLRCSHCNYDLCSACATERNQLPCPVVAGRYSGDSILYPSMSALAITLPEVFEGQRPRGVDALTFLSSQVAGDNTNVGSSGGDEEAAMMNRLDIVFGRMGIEKNGKPKAKPSAVAALVREVMGEGEHSDSLKDEACIICMNEFQGGETMISMPCGHWFHEGEVKQSDQSKKEEEDAEEDEDGSEGSCDGLLPWLQTSNRCPMCRKEIEADTGAAIEKLVPELAGPWTCPGCQMEQSSFICPNCDVRRNVIIAAKNTALPFFESVDALFFDFLGHHERKRRGLDASVQELELFYLRIKYIVSSGVGEQLIQNNWRIREAVEHLLKLAFKGEHRFSFCSPWMDSNSKALYVLLIERLKKKIETLNIPSNIYSFELPSFTPRENEVEQVDWMCPVCSKSNSATTLACGDCGCDSKVHIIADSSDEMQNMQRIFQNAETMVFRAFDIMSDRHASDGLSLSASAALELLRNEVNDFLTSMDIRRVEHAGWKIKCHFKALFDMLCNQERKITFQYYDDVSSAGLYALFIRRLRSRIAEDKEYVPAYAEFNIMEPEINPLVSSDEDFEPFSEQRFYVHGQTFGFLHSQRKLFIKTAHLIAQKASDHYWGDLLETLSMGDRFPIDRRVMMMKAGERNLDVLTDDLECFAQAVVEAILRKVLVIEAKFNDSNERNGDKESSTKPKEGSKDINLSIHNINADTSIDVAVKCLLHNLKVKASEAFLKQSLKLLLKTLRALSSSPNALSSRRLRKSTPAVAQCVLSTEHTEIFDIISRLGFVDEGSHFSLVKLDDEAVREVLPIVERLASEINLV